MNDKYIFGNFLCELREENNLSQKDFGEKLGVTDKAVSKWENAEAMPRLSKLKKISEILGISVEELLSGKKINKNNSEESVEEIRKHGRKVLRELTEKEFKRKIVLFIILALFPTCAFSLLEIIFNSVAGTLSSETFDYICTYFQICMFVFAVAVALVFFYKSAHALKYICFIKSEKFLAADYTDKFTFLNVITLFPSFFAIVFTVTGTFGDLELKVKIVFLIIFTIFTVIHFLTVNSFISILIFEKSGLFFNNFDGVFIPYKDCGINKVEKTDFLKITVKVDNKKYTVRFRDEEATKAKKIIFDNNKNSETDGKNENAPLNEVKADKGKTVPIFIIVFRIIGFVLFVSGSLMFLALGMIVNHNVSAKISTSKHAAIVQDCSIAKTENGYLFYLSKSVCQMNIYDENDKYIKTYCIPNTSKGASELMIFDNIYIEVFRSNIYYKYDSFGNYDGKACLTYPDSGISVFLYDGNDNETASFLIADYGCDVIGFTDNELYFGSDSKYYSAVDTTISEVTMNSEAIETGYYVKFNKLLNGNGNIIDSSSFFEVMKADPIFDWLIGLSGIILIVFPEFIYGFIYKKKNK